MVPRCHSRRAPKYRMIGPALGLVSGADPVSTEPGCICILDDDASVRHSTEQLLDSDGLKAQSFEDAEANTNLEAAEMNQDASMNWGTWGGWGGPGWRG